MDKEDLLHQIHIDRRQLERHLLYFEKDHRGEFVPSKRLIQGTKDRLALFTVYSHNHSYRKQQSKPAEQENTL